MPIPLVTERFRGGSARTDVNGFQDDREFDVVSTSKLSALVTLAAPPVDTPATAIFRAVLVMRDAILGCSPDADL